MKLKELLKIVYTEVSIYDLVSEKILFQGWATDFKSRKQYTVDYIQDGDRRILINVR